MLELLEHSPDQVRAFNKKHPLASFVKYRNDKGEVVEGQVRFPAETMPDGTEVMWLTGSYDAIPLSNIVK